MKKYLLIIFLFSIGACAPVLNEELMNISSTEVPLSDMAENPDFYKGKSFVLGGLIVKTEFAGEGSILEAGYVPVDKRGNFKSSKPSNARFLAVLPKDKGIIEPLLYKQGREVTLAGKFLEVRTDTIEKMEYKYPVFTIDEIYLWEEKTDDSYIYNPYSYGYYYPYYYPYSRFGYSYPYYYVVPKSGKGKGKK